MAIYNRFPLIREIARAFAVCAFPIYLYSIVIMLYEVPAWCLRLNPWDLIGAVAYTQMFALIESLLALVALFVIYALLPGLLKKNFVVFTAVIILISSLWAVAVHLYDETIRLWGIRDFVIAGFLYIATIVFPYILAYKYAGMERIINLFAMRLSVLSTFYISLGLMSTLIIFIRIF